MPTVLILAASPHDQDRLSLNREVKKIKQALERSKNRENWRIESNEAATVEDLRRALLDHNPTVLHFSGHGGGDAGLCFEDDQGGTHLTHAAPLAKLLHHFKEKLKCVVLNACYSQVQGQVIRQQIDYVVGMQNTIGDEAATKFAGGFYDAVFAGCEFRMAFDLACAAIDLHNLAETDVPVFLTSPQLGGSQLSYTENVPEIESFIHAYLNTPFNDRCPFTTKGDRLKDQMRRFYGERMLTSVNKVVVLSKQKLENLHWKVHARLEGRGEKSYFDYYLRIEDRTIKIEWEATVGYWSVPVKTYLAFGTKEGIVARVTAQIGNLYHGDFNSKENQYQNVSLRTSNGENLLGYVRRFEPVYKELVEYILADGNPHNITILLANKDDDTEYPVILKVLSATWILPDTEDKKTNDSTPDNR
jgi:CHAT domain